jgi:hypothetical protein
VADICGDAVSATSAFKGCPAMERTEEISMFRAALRIADLHPDPITLPDDHQNRSVPAV